jgi:hypothetical protein
MKARVLTLAVLASAVVSACASNTGGAQEFERDDVGRNAAIVLAGNLKVQESLELNKIEEAHSILETGYLFQLTLLRTFDTRLSNDELHVRLRDSLVEALQRRWLKSPPEYLDDESAVFLERVCSSIPNCPKGRIVPRRPLPEFPK